MKINSKETIVYKRATVFVPGDAENSVRNNTEDEEVIWFYHCPADKFGGIINRFFYRLF